MIESTTKLIIAPNSRTGLLYIPADLMIDSRFPFQAPLTVKIRISGEQLIIEKAEAQ
jgi:hypothetical protein